MSSFAVPSDRLTPPIIAGAALGVVVTCALLFSVVGAVRTAGAADEGVVAPTTDTTPTGDEAVASGNGEGAADQDGGDGDVAPAAADGESDASGDEPTTEDTTPEADEGVTEAKDGESTGENTPPPSDVEPAEVSIQVLDAVGDGGAAAAGVADTLRGAGFNVIVINGASKGYDVTTVFWSAEQGPGGRAVAEAIGAGRAERTPDEVRLSDSVDVHVVVGADKA